MFARFQIQFQILGWGGLASRGHGLCALGAALAVTVCLGACGQRGPLFMPPPPKAAASSPTSATPGNPVPAAAITTDIPAPPPASPPAFTPR